MKCLQIEFLFELNSLAINQTRRTASLVADDCAKV